MHKNVIIMILLVLMLAFAGCSAQRQGSNTDSSNQRFYTKKVLSNNAILGPAEAYTVKVDNSNLYFLTKDSEEESDFHPKPITQLMKISYSVDYAEPVATLEGWDVVAFDVCEVNGVETYILLNHEEEQYTVCEYNSGGQKTQESAIEYKNDYIFPSDMIYLGQGGYLVLFPNEIVYADKSGKIKTCKCPGEQFYAITALNNNDIYVSFVDMDGQNSIAKLNLSQVKLEVEIKTAIPGLLLCEEKGNVIVTNGNKMFLLNTSTNSLDEVYNFANNRISSDTIRGIESIEGGVNIACCVGIEDVSLSLIMLSEGKNNFLGESSDSAIKYDAEGKRIVYVYSPEGKEIVLDSIGGVIDCFNFENPDYSIEVLKSDSTIDPVLSSDLHPDMVIEEYGTAVEQYAAGGYLEDLYPFIDKSSALTRDDIPDFLKDSFEEDGKLLALFDRFNLSAVLISSHSTTQQDFEPCEFINQIASQNELYTEGTLDKNKLMMICFMQTVDNYVNIKEGTANFETDSFVKLLIALKECNLKDSTSAVISDLAIASGAYNGVYFIKQQVDGLKDIAQTEAALCEKLCQVRLVAEADSNSSYFYLPYNTVGIFANSECKEGAFAFIEYMMTTGNNGMSMGVPSSGNDKAGLCYTLNSIREKAFSDALGEIEVSTSTGVITYAITDEHRKQMESLISEAKYLDDTHARIIGIMMEEADSFLKSDKKPSEVADVVQKRVQILLNERR